jgi:hypothetical protein
MASRRPNAAVSSRERANASPRSARLQSWVGCMLRRPSNSQPAARVRIPSSGRYARRDEKTELDAEDGYRIRPYEKVMTVHVAATSLAREALLTDAYLQPEAITRADWLQQLDAQVIAAKESPFQSEVRMMVWTDRHQSEKV